MKTIGFIGGGNMAQALLEGVLKAGLFKAKNVWVSDVRADRLAGAGHLARGDNFVDHHFLFLGSRLWGFFPVIEDHLFTSHGKVISFSIHVAAEGYDLSLIIHLKSVGVDDDGWVDGLLRLRVGRHHLGRQEDLHGAERPVRGEALRAQGTG